jgi:Uma2 family endonuclease
MATSHSALTFTYEDYLSFPEDGKRHELIDGEHFVTPAPRTKHQQIITNLHRLITPFVHTHTLGAVFSAPTDVVLSDIDVVQPDFLFISAYHTSIIAEANIQGPPDLTVEILSEGTRKTDEVIKRKLYERYGVREYWVVDPVLETVKIYRRRDNQFEPPVQLSREEGQHVTTPLLPQLHIPLEEIFA